MSDGPRPDEGAAEPDLRKLAQDWITLWQSELAGLAVDREAQETWQAMLALWAGVAAAMLRAMPRDDQAATARRRHPASRPAASTGEAHEHAERRAGPVAAAGAAPVAAAPDARDAEIDRLAERVAELERRLAARDDMR